MPMDSRSQHGTRPLQGDIKSHTAIMAIALRDSGIQKAAATGGRAMRMRKLPAVPGFIRGGIRRDQDYPAEDPIRG